MAAQELLYFTEHGSGPPLLLVHGVMVTGEIFDPVIERLAARHRVVVPDLRGHGRSRGLPPPYTAAQLASDLSRVLDHLGIDSTAVLGYSQGPARRPCPCTLPLSAGSTTAPKMLHDGIAGSRLIIVEDADHALI